MPHGVFFLFYFRGQRLSAWGLRLPLALLQFLIFPPSPRMTVGGQSSKSGSQSLSLGTGKSRLDQRFPTPQGGETAFPSSGNVQP